MFSETASEDRSFILWETFYWTCVFLNSTGEAVETRASTEQWLFLRVYLFLFEKNYTMHSSAYNSVCTRISVAFRIFFAFRNQIQVEHRRLRNRNFAAADGASCTD